MLRPDDEGGGGWEGFPHLLGRVEGFGEVWRSPEARERSCRPKKASEAVAGNGSLSLGFLCVQSFRFIGD